MKKVIFNLSILVDEVIHESMSEFKLYGTMAKEMQLNNEPKRDIKNIHKSMAEIFYDLSPFEIRLRELYPSLVDLFDLFSKDHLKK